MVDCISSAIVTNPKVIREKASYLRQKFVRLLAKEPTLHHKQEI